MNEENQTKYIDTSSRQKIECVALCLRMRIKGIKDVHVNQFYTLEYLPMCDYVTVFLTVLYFVLPA